MLSLLVIAVLLLSACQRATPAETDCTAEELLCVGLVTGLEGLNDGSFNQQAWAGIQQAEAELGIRAGYIETEDAKDYAANMQRLVEQGYELIVTVGPAMSAATHEVASANPQVRFIAVDQAQSDELPNLVGLVFRQDHAGFMAGSLAAQMSKSGIIAAVLGPETLPSSQAFKQGFEAGVRYVNPNIQVISTFHPGTALVDATDARWGAGTAAQALQQGADVIFGAGGKIGYGALIETAGQPGVYCIGADIDQWEIAPAARPCLLSSAVKLISAGVFDLIRLAKEGSLPGGNFHGAVGLAPFHDFDSLVSQPVRNTINLISDGLSSGSLTTGYAEP